MAYHQRSASLPSLPHSIEPNDVEDELQALKACVASQSATIDAASYGLRRLGDVYGSVEEMTRLPSNRASLLSLARRQRKTTVLEEELDRSLELIDLCSAVQESLADLRMRVQELRLVLKRGGDVAAAAQLKVDAFVRLAKKKAQLKPLMMMKKTSGRAGSGGAEEGYCRLVRVMVEARETAVCLLETTSRLLPKQVSGPSPPTASKWALVSAGFQKRKKVLCEEQQLRELERSMGGLEDGVEFLFRRLIQSRVSLLNILSS